MWRWPQKFLQTLYGRITVAMVMVILGTVLANLLLARSQVERAMRRAQDAHARNLLQSALANVEAQHRGLLFHKETALKLRKKEIRDVVDFALSVVRDHDRLVRSGEMTLQEAQEMVLHSLRAFRYDNGTGYVWINNVERPLPRVIMHPILPDLDGTVADRPEFYTAYGKRIHLFKAFVDVCLERGEGYVDYLWPKPTPDGLTSLRKKVSFVKLFPEWGWVIGSGLYIDDIDAEAQRKISEIVKDLNETLGPLMIGSEGHLIVFNGNDDILVHPFLSGRSLKGMVEPTTGRPLGELFRDAAASPDSTFTYMWDKPGDEGRYIHMMRARVLRYAPLDWFIATTVYEDEERKPSNVLLRNLLVSGLLIMVAAIGFCLPLVQGLVGPMTRLAGAAERITVEGLHAASMPEGGTVEVRKLGAVLDQMIASIRQSQQQLRESEEKYRSMMEAMDDMVFISDSDFRVEYMNPALVRFLGRNAVGQRCREALSSCQGFCDGCEEDPDMLEALRVRMVHAEGDRHYHITTCPVPHPDGSRSMMSIIRDVSEQTRAEVRLRGVQQYIQNIVNSMPSMVVGLDSSGLISLWNKESAQILGLPAEQVRGRDMGFLPAQFAFLRDMFVSSLASGDVVKRNKVELLLQGEKRYCDVTVYPLDDGGGAVFRIDDVSDLVRMEEVMIQSEKMVSLGGLAAGMAHEINNPLAGIIQNAQVMRTRLGPDIAANSTPAEACGTSVEAVNCYLERRRILNMVDMIMESGVRAARIVENMLSFVRAAGDRKRPENLGELLDRAVDLALNDYDLTRKYDFRQIEIVREYAPDAPKVLCEASKLQQVFMNLLKNGAQAMAEMPERKSRFILRVAGGDDFARVEVEDNGCGLSDAVRKRIFEPFFTTKPQGIGTGLGLSVSYFIVTEHHGGSMRVESVPGKMTNFIMDFPAYQDGGEAGAAES